MSITMRGMSVALIAFAIAFGVSADGFGEDVRVPFETIMQGQHAGRTEPGKIVVDSQVDLERFWRQIQIRGDDYGEPPEVSFTEETVIVLFMGRRNTGGYSIEVDEVRAEPERVTVFYREYAPAPGDAVIQVLTSPFHVVRIPNLSRPIRFSRRR